MDRWTDNVWMIDVVGGRSVGCLWSVARVFIIRGVGSLSIGDYTADYCYITRELDNNAIAVIVS